MAAGRPAGDFAHEPRDRRGGQNLDEALEAPDLAALRDDDPQRALDPLGDDEIARCRIVSTSAPGTESFPGARLMAISQMLAALA